jgi:hypothetical protein
MNDYITEFLFKSLFGRDTDLTNSGQLVMACIDKAYKDL